MRQPLHALALLLSAVQLNAQDYCTPTTTFGPDGGSYIARVQMGGAEAIDNTTTFTPGTAYQDFTYGGPGLWTRIQAGNTYFLTITAGTFVGTQYAAWIDFNGNGEFAENEQVASQASTSAGQAMIISIDLPEVLLPLVTRLRVRAAYNMTTPDPCANFLYGETEDYLVVIENSAPCVPFSQYGTTQGDRITGISLAGENLSITEQGAYLEKSYGPAPVLGFGSDQVIQVTSGEYAESSIAVWADWSGSGAFGDWAPEFLGAATTSSPFETVSIPFTVPTDYPEVGQLRLRIRLWFGDVPDPCNTQNYGQTIDLTAAIALPSGPCPVGVGSYYPGLPITAVDLNGTAYPPNPWVYPFYQMMLEPGTTLIRGTEQTLSVTSTGVGRRTSAWMDLNGDGDFSDVNELIGISNGNGDYTFSVPASTPIGHSWIRIRTNLATPDPETDGCAFITDFYPIGTMMDIRVTVQDPEGPCIPQSTYWTLFGDFIDGVELNTLSNTGTGGLAQAEYHDYTALSTTLAIGSSQVLSITSGENPTDWLGAGIDWNGDGTWESAGEFLGVFSAGGSFSTVDIPFTVPNVTPGPKRMRVRAFPSSTASACAGSGFGETEDYTVVVETNTGLSSSDEGAPQLIADVSGQGAVLLSSTFWNGSHVEVLDLAGRRMWSGSIMHIRQVIDLPSGSSGIYTLKLQQGDRRWAGRFVHMTR